MTVSHKSSESIESRRITSTVKELMRRKKSYPNLYETEFIGINISDSGSHAEGAADEIKLYVYGGSSDNDLVEHLHSLDMVGCTETVLSNQAGSHSRINIGLKNRDSRHMLKLREHIMQNFPYMAEHAKEFDHLLEIPVSSEPGYELASLFYLGLSSSEIGNESLKLYFITRRFRKDVEDIHRDYSFDNERYLDYIARLSVFEPLTGMAKCILSHRNIDLWMVGVDYNSIIPPRRKLYFCCVNRPFPLSLLPDVLHEAGAGRLSAEMDALVDELSESACFTNLTGFAVSGSRTGMILNLYFSAH